MKVIVKTIRGEPLVLVDTSETVDSVKTKVAEAKGIPVNQQRLVYGVKEMESGHKLSDYDIQEESTIHVMLGMENGSK